MLQFAVYDEDGPARQWHLSHAHMLGTDDQPIAGRVAHREGRLECRISGTHAAALCLQHEAGSMGSLMLQTCLLPPRDEPYLLTLELARHRIKSFLAKSEEWQMFDLSATHPAMRHWEEARELLTQSLTTRDPREASRIAQESLIKALEASERLAMAHAEILLHRRFANRAASSATLGVRIWPGRNGMHLRELVSSNFDLVIVPLRWRELEVEEGEHNWSPIDRWVEWAHAQGKPIVLGPLIDFSKDAVPDWMYVWQHDYDTCRDLVYDYIERVVQRYRSVVGMWNIASGVNVNDNFEFNAAQMIDLVRMANLLVKQSRKGARTMIELRQPFGEHVALRPDSMPPSQFIDRLVQEGIKFDALGVQLLFGGSGDGRAVRDVMQISSLLDRFFLLELPVLVSSMGVPSSFDELSSGYWHEPWNAEVQSRWISRIFAVALSKPFVESIFWTDLFDHELAELPHAGLISDQGQPKPAFSRLLSMRKRLRRPLGPLHLPTRAAT